MAALLKKIVVKNVGVLRAFNTPNSPQLEALTSFYARNGRGKTTLSTILRSASTNDPLAILGRRTLTQNSGEPEVSLVFEDGTVQFVGGKWKKPVHRLEVFDGTFIADNIYAGEAVELAQDRSLFRVILGKDGVKLANQQEFFVAAAKRTAQKLKEAEAALADDLPSDMTREEFFVYAPADDLDQRVEQGEKDLKRILQGDQLSKLKKFQPVACPAHDIGMATVLGSTVAHIEASARDHLAAHFKKFQLGRDGEAWVRFGLGHIHDDSCPLCGKPDVGETGLVAVYGQIFGDAYKGHLDGIKQLGDKIEAELGMDPRGQILATVASNAETLNNWSEFFAIGDVQLPHIAPAVEQISAAHQTLKALLDAKRQSPLTPLHDDAALEQSTLLIQQAGTSLHAYNKAIADVETLIQQKMQASSSLTEQHARERLLNLRRRQRRSEAGVSKRIETALSSKRRDTRAKKIRTLVQERLKVKNTESAGHYHSRVNHYLDKFGAKFRISNITNSMPSNVGQVDYGLIVRGHDVARGRGRALGNEPTFLNTLSTGDKTTLAFAFFLAQLDGLDAADLKDRIVVFDDPLSSHDTHREGKTVDCLFGLCGRCAQMIVLSHAEYFLRRLHRRCNKSTKAVYQIEFDGPEDWSVAQAADLDQLCESQHAKRLRKLRAYYDARLGDPSDVGPAIRTVLETHYRATYPAYFGADANLGAIVQAIKTCGPSHPCWDDHTELDSCNVHTLGQHHGEDPGVPAAEPMDPDELHVIVGTCLALVHAIPQ